MDKIIKTPGQVAKQMERWFLLYHRKDKADFNGREPFTLFHHLYFEKQNELIRKMQLPLSEIPVFILTIENDQCIINTTERFLRIADQIAENIFYPDFKQHTGFRSVFENPKSTHTVMSNIKKTGYYAPFGIEKGDGEIVYWNIPTGKPGFAFWNVTNKCELIGRKYLIEK